MPQCPIRLENLGKMQFAVTALLLLEGLSAAGGDFYWECAALAKSFPRTEADSKPFLTPWDWFREESNFRAWVLGIDFNPINTARRSLWWGDWEMNILGSDNFNLLLRSTFELFARIFPYMHFILHKLICIFHLLEGCLDWFRPNCVRIPTHFHPGVALRWMIGTDGRKEVLF